MFKRASVLAAALCLSAPALAADGWDVLVEKMSSSGAVFDRQCNGATQLCSTVAMLPGNDISMMLMVTEDSAGKRKREVCIMNGTADRMLCVDYDTKAQRTTVYDTSTHQWSGFRPTNGG